MKLTYTIFNLNSFFKHYKGNLALLGDFFEGWFAKLQPCIFNHYPERRHHPSNCPREYYKAESPVKLYFHKPLNKRLKGTLGELDWEFLTQRTQRAQRLRMDLAGTEGGYYPQITRITQIVFGTWGGLGDNCAAIFNHEMHEKTSARAGTQTGET